MLHIKSAQIEKVSSKDLPLYRNPSNQHQFILCNILFLLLIFLIQNIYQISFYKIFKINHWQNSIQKFNLFLLYIFKFLIQKSNKTFYQMREDFYWIFINHCNKWHFCVFLGVIFLQFGGRVQPKKNLHF